MRWAWTVATVAGAVVLTGCTSAPSSSPEALVATASASSSPSPTAAPPTAAPAVPDPAIPECPNDVAEGIDGTVSTQLEAFAAGDFRSAFALASESFRSSIGLKGFREVIVSGYPEVAAAVDHRVVACRQLGPRRADALVAVTGENGVTAQIGYRFVLETGGWRVDGASTLATESVQTA